MLAKVCKQRSRQQFHDTQEWVILFKQQKTMGRMPRLDKISYEPWHEISNNLVCAASKGSDQPAHMHSLIRAFANCLNVL